MSLGIAEKIAKATLYEGYNLYPYQPDALKNQQRWTFGGLLPRTYAEAQEAFSSDRWFNQTQVLVRGSHLTRVRVVLRFLHLVDRRIKSADGQSVESVSVDGKRHFAWEEAHERDISLPEMSLAALIEKTEVYPFQFGGSSTEEPIQSSSQQARAWLTRSQEELAGNVEVGLEARGSDLYRLTVRVANLSPFSGAQERKLALHRTLVSAHTILSVKDGEFVSLLDPPDECKAEALSCENLGTWPVLVGKPGVHELILSSPIILYDFPEVAPESPGDFFDGTEMDEMLSLRIQTLTDDEKERMRSVDDRTRALLERTEALSPEEILSLHGRLRGEQANTKSIQIGGVILAHGSKVRLRPRKSRAASSRADIFDTILEGMTATVEAIEEDFENEIHLAVTVDEDPGRDLGQKGMPGHRFFFKADEVEPL